jgi:hypothetical protein
MYYSVLQDNEPIETGCDSRTQRAALSAALELHAETMDSQRDINRVQRVVGKGSDQDVIDMASNFGFEVEAHEDPYSTPVEDMD